MLTFLLYGNVLPPILLISFTSDVVCFDDRDLNLIKSIFKVLRMGTDPTGQGCLILLLMSELCFA